MHCLRNKRSSRRDELFNIITARNARNESKKESQDGVGVGRGRKARKRIQAFEKSVCPRMALLIGAA